MTRPVRLLILLRWSSQMPVVITDNKFPTADIMHSTSHMMSIIFHRYLELVRNFSFGFQIQFHILCTTDVYVFLIIAFHSLQKSEQAPNKILKLIQQINYPNLLPMYNSKSYATGGSTNNCSYHIHMACSLISRFLSETWTRKTMNQESQRYGYFDATQINHYWQITEIKITGF